MKSGQNMKVATFLGSTIPITFLNVVQGVYIHFIIIVPPLQAL
jgi:hypothetical protein